MTTTLKKMSALVLASAVTFSMLSSQALANGAIGDHVNNLHAHIGEYTEEVHWLESKFGSVVDAYRITCLDDLREDFAPSVGTSTRDMRAESRSKG